MENNKTAVEWLFHQLWEEPKDKFTWYAILEKAKEMEKKQIINTWTEATSPDHEIGLSDTAYILEQIRRAEKYYNEKFGDET